MTKRVIAIQHTQSAHHLSGMVGSWTDWELTELGRKHAENIGRRLSEELKGQNWKIYSSDLARARQTVEPLARHMNLDIHFIKDLREMNAGEAVGKDKQWCNENRLPTPTYDDREFIGAETWREFWQRVESVCERIASDDAENIIIASHGVTLCVWQSVWQGIGIHDFAYVGKPGGVSFMEITDDSQRIITRWNDTFYMR